MEYEKQTLIAFIAVSTVVSLGIIFVAFGTVPSENPDNKVEVGEIITEEQDPSNTNEYVEAVENSDGSYTIKGRIVGSSGGGEVVVNSVEESNNSVTLSLEVNTSGLGTAVVTGYDYSVNIKNIDSDTSLTVKYGEDKFTNLKDREKVSKDNNLKQHNSTGEIDVSVVETGTTSAYEESASVTEWVNNHITVNGQIIAEQGGEKLVIKNYTVENGVIKVNMDTKPPSDGVYPQVILSKNYEMKINSTYDISDFELVVNYVEGKEYSFNEESVSQSSASEDTVDAKLKEKGSYHSDPKESVKVNFEDQKAQIRGTIVGNTGGQEVVIESVENKDGKTYVNVDLEKPNKFVTQVITGYNYHISVSNVESEVVVMHSGEEVYKSDDKEKELLYTFEQQKSTTIDSVAQVTEQKQDSFTIEGSFVTGSSSCTKAGLDSLRVQDSVLKVELSPQSTGSSNIVCTDDIAPSGYRLKVDSSRNIDSVMVEVSQAYDDTIVKEIDV